MSNWFDGIAKRAARSAPAASASVKSSAVDDADLSRRQVLARGAVLTGVAWTAPALLAARPAFAGASMCPATRPVFDVCGDGTEVCCPTGQECVLTTQGTYECDIPPGGECGNRGNGQCNGGFSRCDQPSNTSRNGICGGPGTACADDSACQFDNCGDLEGSGVQGRRCGGLNADCAIDTQCAEVDANNTTVFVCDLTMPSPTAPGTCQPVA